MAEETLMVQQRHGRLVGLAAVDLDHNVIARHPATLGISTSRGKDLPLTCHLYGRAKRRARCQAYCRS